MRTLTFKRLAVYLLTFFILLIIGLTLTTFWKKCDTAFYKKVYMDESNAASKLSSNIAVVKIVKPNLDSKNESLSQFRKKIISFLNTVEHHDSKNEAPEAIIFDISFSNDTTQLKELKEAIERVKAKRINVYAVYNLKHYFEQDSIFETNDFGQARVLYDSVLVGGRLHSGFVADKKLIYYPSDIFLNTAFGDTLKVESIVKRVALNKGANTFAQEFKNLVTPLGPIEAMEEQTYTFIKPQDASKSFGSFDRPLDMHQKYILVGDLENDYQKDIETPRTYFLAWALNERIIEDKIVKQPIDNLWIIIGQTLFFSLLTVLVFALLFKYLKSFQTKPKLLGLISFLISLIFFAIYGLLIYVSGSVIPIGMTLMGMAIAAILAWRFAHKFLVTGIVEGSQKYDLFISYSHGNSEWVKENVYEPLKDFKKPNGEKLNIFFDLKSIGIGEAFTSKYMWGIVDSKLFVPIMSEEYYGKNHCKNEMDLAYKRHVEKLIGIMPIAYTFECVPEIYTHINVAVITVVPNFIENIKEALSK
ncbi:MAG: hypothetical protein DA407_05255 [Bacteroidetes bacterium]|nr:MAG: hypothetical protein DA407_05255 [Bacteroidota bacterium]